MDYVPAKILSKQASVYSPTSDAMSGYALAVRHDRLDYSVTKGGLRLWIVVIVFILLISGLVTVFSNKELDFDTESEETSEEKTSGELLQHERELLERKIELHKAKKRKGKVDDVLGDESSEVEFAISHEKSDEEEEHEKPKIRSKHASEEEERRLREISEKAEAKRIAVEKEARKAKKEEEEQAEEPQIEEEEEEKEEEVPIVKPQTPKKEKAPSKIVEPKKESEEDEEEEEPVKPVKPPKKVPERHTEPSAKKVKKEPESHVEPPSPPAQKQETKPVKVFKTKGKAKEERFVTETEPSEEPEPTEEEEEVEQEGEPQEEEEEPVPVPKKIKSKPSIPVKTFRTKGREKGAIEYITSFFSRAPVEEEEIEVEHEEEEEHLEERFADEETCEAGAKCHETEEPPKASKKPKKEPIKIRYTKKKGREPEDRIDSERYMTESFAVDDEEEAKEEEEEEEVMKEKVVKVTPQKPLIPIKTFRTKGGAERETVVVVERVVERKKPQIPIKTFRTKGTDVVADEGTVTYREEKPKKPVLPVKVFRTKGGEERKVSHDDDESDEFDDVVALKIEKKMQKTAPPAYRKHAITNREDNKIRTRLDQADRLIEERELDAALTAFDQILKSYPSSPRAHYGRARTLDLLSELKQSNSMLEESIRVYELIMELPTIPDELYVSAANRLVDRSKFRGWVKKALDVQTKLVDKFPNDLTILNDYGVTFLIMGRNDDAKKVFETVLVKEPDNGFALAHYGFILKTAEEKLEDAVDYLRRGISSNEYGTQDGRFFFQLGDALQRLNRSDEAYEVYEEGAQKGLFLSKLQRSLYNVDDLTARPWWTPEQTTYANHLKTIENEWRTIKEEGVALLDQKNVIFKKEDERLTNKGDWRQFTLYLRGKKNEENCAKAPKTCALVEKFPEAVGCTRGQIKFSVMEGGTQVWPHCGPTNCRLRGHLGLIVPPDPRIRVGNETRAWKRGKFIIFDDSFEHEVWYEGSGFRLVLIVDFWHPELTPQQRASLTPI